MSLTAKSLKAHHRKIRDEHPAPLSLRVHRAISWLAKAELSEDHDTRFIMLWIAFNAAYSQDTGLTHISDSHKFNQFLDRMVQLDDHNALQQHLWKEFTQAIRVLLDNPYVYQPYWNHQNGIEGYEDWQMTFTKAKQAAQHALMTKDTAKVLGIVFHRLYTLRNQIMHGGATWNGQTNRQQLKDATQILGKIVPIIINIMMSHPEQIWGEACYPVVE
ncbi:HEPN domain-containing protein [Hydrogenovibrio halophilus]|uniref:HEPN domain-containing protein n=1 Tax=Hydrogenovibrio halophilus TaxID=373391 RepID=UPI0004905958|nr:HEPN domain-containing protein [Hydrogenovibrio halophilus]